MVLTGGIFVIFFSTSMVNVAKADIQWNDEYIPVYEMIHDETVDLDDTGDELVAIHDDDPQAGGPPDVTPDAGGPNENPPVASIEWWQIIGSFIDAMLASLAFWGMP